MRHASEIMDEPVLTTPTTSVRELADLLESTGADGVCVVDASGLVGVATTMDLIRRETSLHLPATLVLLDAVITLPGERKRAEAELHRIVATTVGELMTRDPVTVLPSATVQECADRMVNEHLSILPVVDASGALVGMVTKHAMIRTAGLLSDATKGPSK